MLMKSLACFTVAAALILGGCATPSFYPFEGRNNVHQGKGGSRFNVAGIDVWFNGEPSHTYSILGYIEDNRSVGIDTNHKSIPDEVLKKAIEVGADGLIETVTTTRADTGPSTGMILHGGSRGAGMGFGFGYGVPIREEVTVKYTAVKYLD